MRVHEANSHIGLVAGIALVIALWLLIRRWKRERNDAQVKQWVDEVVTLLHHQVREMYFACVCVCAIEWR